MGYEPYMLMFNEWWKQLFGESEGKDGKGLYPASVVFSTDLHCSVSSLFRTATARCLKRSYRLRIPEAVTIPEDSENVDGLGFFFAGKPLTYVNETAMKGNALPMSTAVCRTFC